MLLLLLISVFLALWLHLLLRLVKQERQLVQQLQGQVPNVSRLPLIGAAWQMLDFQPDNLHEKFAQYVQRFGRTFMATVMGQLIVVTAEPSYVDALLLSQQQLSKSVIYGALRGWLGNGLLLSRGEKWHSMRKIITPTFHFGILEQFVEVFDRQSNVLIEKLQPLANGIEVIDIYPLMGLATLDIISETAMGVSLGAQFDQTSPVVQSVKDVTNTLATRFMRPHLLPRPLFKLLWPSGYRRQQTGIKCLRRFTDCIIQQRRELLQQEMGTERRQSPLLDTLLKATWEGKPLTDQQIRDEVSTFIFEGHDTTTSAASFCLYLLSRHAEVQQQLFQELNTHYGPDLQRGVVYNDIAELPYLNCVVKEALRLYPPIPAVGRCLEQSLVVGSCEIPAGTNVIVLIWQLLRDEQLYEDPLSFRPERHFSTTTTSKAAYSFIPFSAGPRNCIGQRFALYEVKTIVIKMLRHFQLLPLGAEVKPSIKIVLRSATGVNFGLKPRIY